MSTPHGPQPRGRSRQRFGTTHRFGTTQWSVVLAAGGSDTGIARPALATLCEVYWYPLYAYSRRRGSEADEAADLVQGFFTELIEKSAIAAADPERGRFRGFLVTSFRRFVSRQQEHDSAAKRGGGVAVLSLDFAHGEQRYAREPADTSTPERIYERRWALTILETVIVRLQDEVVRGGRAELFDSLKCYLDGSTPVPAYADVAERLGMTVGAVKVSVHRLRRRYRDLLRATVADTLTDPAAVDEELRHLLEAVRG